MMDFEAWRCCHDDSKFCPDEGCSEHDGCAREKYGDSYGSWCLAIRAWREIRVRSGDYDPKTEQERQWALAGPVAPSRLESVLSPSTDTGG